ncbi:hypothetical protein HK102_005342, partial [Quaeritorhiza haematococci]
MTQVSQQQVSLALMNQCDKLVLELCRPLSTLYTSSKALHLYDDCENDDMNSTPPSLCRSVCSETSSDSDSDEPSTSNDSMKKDDAIWNMAMDLCRPLS